MNTGRTILLVLAAAALAAGLDAPQSAGRPPAGNVFVPEDLRPADRWQSSESPDSRAELLFPVNVVRIFSDEHSADAIAPADWVRTQVLIANRLFRFSDAEMAGFGPNRPAPCLQFRVNKFYDVHESEVSEILGQAFDTENVYGASAAPNGSSFVGTRELRTLKVTDEEDYLTIYCVWSLKNPDEVRAEFGGESNVGFADRIPTGPRRVLTRVTSVRAILGVVGGRQEGAFMSMVAHELGHYFGLPHAWEREPNRQRGLSDLGDGPQGRVDPDPFFANLMDYDAGPRISQYMAKSQLDFAFRFARDRASQFVRAIKTGGGGAAPPPPPGGQPTAEISRVWVDSPAPGGEVAVHVRFSVRDMRGQRGDAVAWFSWSSGEKLKDFDGQYRSMAGQVSVASPITPGYDDALYEDLVLRIPGGQLHLAEGTHALGVVAGVFRGDTMLAISPPAGFTYTLGGAPTSGSTGGEPAAWFTDVKVDPAVSAQGRTWVRVGAWLTVDNLLGQDVTLQARYYFPDGTPLRDFDGAFAAADGLAMAENKVRPLYPRTNLTDMQVWIPVSELHLVPGQFQIQARLTLVHAGKTLASAASPVFTVTSAPAPVAKSASIQSVSLTHNHQGGGQLGLVVHVNAVINGCQNEPCSVVAWFHDAAANRLKDFDGQYTTQDGQASASISVTPLYPSTTFTEIQVFMPYAQLHLAPGLHNLGARVGIFQGSTMLGKREELALFQVQWRPPAGLQEFVKSRAQRAISAWGGR
jgi:hypothetical protein